jgi:hypothetical protein
MQPAHCTIPVSIPTCSVRQAPRNGVFMCSNKSSFTFLTANAILILAGANRLLTPHTSVVTENCNDEVEEI